MNAIPPFSKLIKPGRHRAGLHLRAGKQSGRSALLVVALGFVLAWTGCERTVIPVYPEFPDNPFDQIDYGQGVLEELPLDSSSLLGLHRYLFAPTCAQPGCHDGSFEPDFRTVQSAYQTLVYHPVIKNNEGENYQYRVVPGNRAKSWLWERVTTDDAVLGRMPLYDTLTPGELEAIRTWIDQGAPDAMGVNAVLPNVQPSVYGWLAYDREDSTRYDLNRLDAISPMRLPAGREVAFYFGVYDFDDQGVFGAGFEMTFNKARIGDHPYAIVEEPYRDMQVLPAASPVMGSFFFDPTGSAPFYHRLVVNTDEFVRNRVYFVRLYVQDSQHDQPTEWPESGSQYYLLSLMSFMVE
ncbi:MAG: hypothetical protein GC205_07695 [Bacteroidetes bacterium]|nr:hypothetical protein [Bacteroidota bacterium]